MKYHVAWITKYRYKVLRGEIAVRTRDLLRQICEGREVVIVQGSVSPDH
ncbi:MAG: transposase, partial [Acidobacteriaceae bacterium]